MMNLGDLIDLLACPDCGAVAMTVSESPSGCECGACGRLCVRKDGFLDMLPEDMEYSPAQRFFHNRLLVKGYDSFRHSNLVGFFSRMNKEEEIDLLVDCLEMEEGSTLLDLACGSGYFSRAFLEAVPGLRLIGLDLSGEMLTMARDILEAPFGDRLFLIRGDAMSLPLVDDGFSRVSCCGGLHDFPEPYSALEQISRVAADRGARFAGLTFASTDEDASGFLKKLYAKFLGVTFVGMKQAGEKLKNEGFTEFTYQYARSVGYFCATR